MRENPPRPYRAAFPVGSRVTIRDRVSLESFRRDWRFHHPLQPDQIEWAGRTATVGRVSYYHGGNVLYRLDGVPGIWHEVCLSGERAG